MKYTHLISKLEDIIENWYDKEELHKLIEYPTDGLCDNITGGYSEKVPKDCFTSWKYFSGSLRYPVGGEFEYYSKEDYLFYLFNNPKRLHLAVHMVIWLRQHNI